MTKTHKTTAAEFAAFQESFRHWQDKLGLLDWRIDFKLQPLKGCYAEIWPTLEGRSATVVLGTEVSDWDRDSYDPARHGRHEALHLATYRLYWLGGMRHVAARELEEEWESLVRRLETTLGKGMG